MLRLSTRKIQGCKLLSDIGQCPTKFGKCPSKSNFDRTLVRSQKKVVTLYIFLLWQNTIANLLNLHFAITFTRHSSILLTVTLRRNGYTYLSRDLYIYLVTYICPTKFSGVGFCPTKFNLCPTKIKSDRTNVLSRQIFICSPEDRKEPALQKIIDLLYLFASHSWKSSGINDLGFDKSFGMAWYCNLFVCFNVLSDLCGTGPQTSGLHFVISPYILYAACWIQYKDSYYKCILYLLAWLVHHVHVCIIATITFI
jgi:hypothetical protein